MSIELYHGDCLEVMTHIASKSIDCVICDLPYEITANKWDSLINLETLWNEYKRIVKQNGAICLFAQEPFTSKLIMSNLKGFKYRWDWNKKIPSGMAYAKYRPMQQTEDICVFTINGEKTIYYPQMIKRDKPIKAGGNSVKSANYHDFKCMNGDAYHKTYDYKNPITLIEFQKIRKGALHPTQKPVELIEYLLKTYTIEGGVILDNCMGSGTTGVACKHLNRSFIGIEKDEKYFSIAKERINAE